MPKSFQKEIDFISSIFDQICEDHFEDFLEISIDTLLQILNNENLFLQNEDQLLNFVNKLFLKNKEKYSLLYETIHFQNVSNKAFQDFVSIFDIDYLNRQTWLKLTKLIKTNQEKEIPLFRYVFKGIVNNLKIRSNDHIEKEIKITASSLHSGVTSAYNDGNSWVTVDERKDCEYLNGKNFTHTFEMNNKNPNAFKYVRMQITGKNCQQYYYLFMNSIEFYGKLV